MTSLGLRAMRALRATMRLQTNIVELVEQETNISTLNAEITIDQMQQDIAALQQLVDAMRRQQAG